MSAKTAIITLIIGELIGIFRLVLQLLHDNGVSLNEFLLSILKVNFLHFSVFLFILSILIIKIGNQFSKAHKSEAVLEINSSLKENLLEIVMNFRRILNLKSLNPNFVISIFIVFAIILLWSVWN